MEPSSGNPDVFRGPSSPTPTTSIASSGSSASSTRQHQYQLTASDFFHSPLSSLLEYSGILGTRSNHSHSNTSVSNTGHSAAAYGDLSHTPTTCLDDLASPEGRDVRSSSSSSSSNGEVSIRILSAGEQEHNGVETALPFSLIGQAAATHEATTTNDDVIHPVTRTSSATSFTSSLDGQRDSVTRPPSPGHDTVSASASPNAEPTDGVGVNQNRDSSYQRYDIQQAARWIEQVLPFSLLLLVVFIRQHLQGFIITIWVAAFMFKSNDILRKQTALKGERRHSILFGISLAFTLHVTSIYWWFQTELLYPLVMIPPKAIPPFWHATFIIVVNDTLVRQAAMVLKCVILMCYKNSRSRNYRKQGQMLTLVEYFLLLYRALLPAPVWYRFFFNKEYGSVFSSLVTGLYLTFKLTSIVEKVQCFFASFKALFRKEIIYGAYATSEQVSAAGDLCAICQEKMHAPILLRCKHIFCEDCVSEWFERERTCPLCRALVKPADIRSFGDGSTSLFFQLF